MEFCNGILLQLFECIESTQNEVKRKMIEADARIDVPKSFQRIAREKSLRDITVHSQVFPITWLSAAGCNTQASAR
jgi:hypothetical protein